MYWSNLMISLAYKKRASPEGEALWAGLIYNEKAPSKRRGFVITSHTSSPRRHTSAGIGTENNLDAMVEK
jgi:hypothetical protein